MKKVIIYENSDKTIAIIIPTEEGIAIGLSELGKRSTPSGLPFWVVNESVIPIDRTYRAIWELDGSQEEPDGYGNEENYF